MMDKPINYEVIILKFNYLIFNNILKLIFLPIGNAKILKIYVFK